MQFSSRAFVKAEHPEQVGLIDSKLVAYKPIVHSRVSIVLKRLIDILVSVVLLVFLTPTLLPIVALLVLMDSKGGVFFVQERTGLKKKPFRCYKIRTMHNAGTDRAEEMLISRLGMVLRRSHIDELPQLLNVLLGQMSLVGPRPHMLSDTKEFESRIANYHLRHAVRPGITGLAQVKGFYGSVDSSEHLEKRVQHDIEYVYTWSCLGDLKIMLLTLTEPLNVTN